MTGHLRSCVFSTAGSFRQRVNSLESPKRSSGNPLKTINLRVLRPPECGMHPAYSGAFLLTVVFGSFFSYSSKDCKQNSSNCKQKSFPPNFGGETAGGSLGLLSLRGVTICPETITELICFQFLRCKNYITEPELNCPTGLFRQKLRYGKHSNPL